MAGFSRAGRRQFSSGCGRVKDVAVQTSNHFFRLVARAGEVLGAITPAGPTPARAESPNSFLGPVASLHVQAGAIRANQLGLVRRTELG